VSVGLVVVLIAVGGAAIALWIDARFSRLAPGDFRGIMLHAGAALLVGSLVPPGIQLLLAPESPGLTLLAIFGVAFPAIVYAFLVMFWTVKMAQTHLRGLLP